MDTNFVVYIHKTLDTDELFYVGEGRPNRPDCLRNRNKYWKAKVAKHGFKSEIIACQIEKHLAEELEEFLINELKNNGYKLTNLCNGTMFGHHWLTGKPKEMHPMFGKKRTMPEVSESNKKRTGLKMKPRPDLIIRNKTGKFNHYVRKVLRTDTNEVYQSLKDAAIIVGCKRSSISTAIKRGTKLKGTYWNYVD